MSTFDTLEGAIETLKNEYVVFNSYNRCEFCFQIKFQEYTVYVSCGGDMDNIYKFFLDVEEKLTLSELLKQIPLVSLRIMDKDQKVIFLRCEE